MCVLDDEQIEFYAEEYYKDGARKIRGMVDVILAKNFGEVDDKDHFYSAANQIFVEEVLTKYDSDKGKFQEFCYYTLCRRLRTEMTALNRDKRMPYLRDENGNKILDDDNKPVRITITSLNVPLSDDIDDGDCLIDTIEARREISDKIENPLILQYMSRLSKMQIEILRLLSDGYRPVDVQEILNISKKQYDDRMLGIHSYENTKILCELF